MKSIAMKSHNVNPQPDRVCPDCGRPVSVCTCHRRSIHFQHGEDRAILGLSRDKCRNSDQLAGFDAMTRQIAAWHGIAFEGIDDDGWGAELQARLDAAERRRAWAIALAGEHQPTIAAAGVFDVAIYNRVEVYA